MGKSMDFISGDGMALSGTGSTTTEKKVTIGIRAGGITADMLAEKGGAAQFFVGELYFQLAIRPGFVWANGQVLSNVSVNYPKLKAWLLDTSAQGGSFLRKTLTEWNAEWNSTKWNAPAASGRNGMSPFYVLDESANSIKVPDLRGAYQAAAGFNGADSGKTLADAIRNITGKLDWSLAGDTVTNDTTSALYWYHPNNPSHKVQDTNDAGATDIRLDISRVHPTGLVVMPRSIAAYLCLYAAGPAA
jgi:hypothetical protein